LKSANKTELFTPLQDLALIGDRRTCALLDKQGNIVWYCPKRFDNPSLFAHLLDAEKGGSWTLDIKGMKFDKRAYLEDSALLHTHFKGEKGNMVLEDFMPLNGRFYGLCRSLSPAPLPYAMQINPRPNYCRQLPVLEQKGERHAVLEYDFHLYTSHRLLVERESISCQIPAGEKAWFIFAEKALDNPEETLQEVREFTLRNWRDIASHITYKGPFEEEARNSLRQLRLLTYATNGGIIAAATTSLPEVIGGKRNYDYRYVWLRDAAMIVSALARAGSDGEEERKFLDFMCASMHRIPKPVVPMLTLDMQPAGTQQTLNFSGYKRSTPVQYGNGASDQLQLDANSNVLIAAKVIYNRYNTREHWETIQRLANFVVDHWREKDHGIWEETQQHHYTSSKIIASISLKYIAEHSKEKEEKKRWQETAKQIRQWVEENCTTSAGAYAVHAGSEDVDVSAVLFPLWGYTEADSEKMLKTVKRLEQKYCRNHLYHRHLVEFNSGKEGAFLAGTLWVAQYWVMRREWDKVQTILKAALRFMNDVGIMPEEGDPVTGEWLGNLPQTFVHASLIGAIIDYKEARYGKEEEEKAAGKK
jgi:GH15 family glucan-1,4-alpha-glucosidase